MPIIKHKRSSVEDKKPTVGQLDLAELSINTNDGNLYIKKDDSDGEVIVEFQNFNDPVTFFNDVTLGDDPTDTHIVNGGITMKNSVDIEGVTRADNIISSGDISAGGTGTFAQGATIGRVTIDDSDTIGTTSGDLNLVSASGYVNVINDLIVTGNVVAPSFTAGSGGVTLPTSSVTLGTTTQGAYVKSLNAGDGIILAQTNADDESNIVTISASLPSPFPDNFVLALGDDSDLQIYHDASNSYINNAGTGDLILTGSNNVIVSTTFKTNGNTDLGNAESDTITATGRFDSSLVPSTNKTRNLGTNTLRWDNIYADSIDLSSNLTVDGNTDLGNAESDTITATGRFDSSLVPSSNLARSLGTTSLRWANVYAQDFGLDENDKMQVSTSQIDFYINGSNEFRMEADGDFHADGDIFANSTTTASDLKLKENVETINNPFDILNGINGVFFNWKKDSTPSAGVIAQEVEEVLPRAVKESGVKDTHKSVDYNQLIGVLVEAIKELKEEVETLKGK